jgi:hypothetical protein
VRLALLVVIVLARVARADAPHVEIGAGIITGDFDAGSTSDLGFGAEARLAVRWSWLALVGRGDVIGLKQPGTGRTGPDDGIVVRVGGDVRFSVAHSGEGRRRDDLWVGGGLGYESGQWELGAVGSFARPDVDLALGYTISSVLGSTGKSHDDVDFMLEVDGAHSPTSRSDPTLTSAIDHSVLFSMVFSFGPG